MAKPKRQARARNLNHRSSARVRRSARFLQWIGDQQANLSGTETGTVFTSGIGTGIFTAVANGLGDGEGPYQATSDTTLPAGMFDNADYYVVPIDADDFQLLEGRKRFGVPVIPTDAGVGIHTLTKRDSNGQIVSMLRNNQPVVIEDAVDIDDLA